MLCDPSLDDAFADIISIKKQIEYGIPPEDLVCEGGMFKVIREKTNTIACVKSENVEKLVARGWAKSVDEKILEEEITELKTSVGVINKLYVEPITSKSAKLTPKTSVIGYDLAFEVCASFEKIYVPEILIKSDSETQRYEIPDNVESNTCITSATIIKAAEPNSIEILLLNTGDISNILNELEIKISLLQDELNAAKESLTNKSSSDYSSISKIPDLRKQLNSAKEELYRLYFTLYAKPQEKYDLQKLSFSGTAIEGETVNILSTKRAVIGDFTYDVVFEACAGKKQVNLPGINASSDKETVEIKLGNKISPNTCQKTSLKINAIDPETIILKNTGNVESEKKISSMDDQITKLDKEIKNQRELLRVLIHDSNKPSDYKQQVEEHTRIIIELRNNISSLKTDWNKILYQSFR